MAYRSAKPPPTTMQVETAETSAAVVTRLAIVSPARNAPLNVQSATRTTFSEPEVLPSATKSHSDNAPIAIATTSEKANADARTILTPTVLPTARLRIRVRPRVGCPLKGHSRTLAH